MADLSQLMNAFVGEATAQPATPTGQWQQELLAQVNPEEARRKQIRNTLIAASSALLNTKGNLLKGLGAAANQGAQSWATTDDANDTASWQAKRTIEEQQAADKDRKLRWLQSAFGIQAGQEDRNYQRTQDQYSRTRQQEQDAYNREKDERDYGIRKQNADSLTTYRTRKGDIDAAKAGIDGVLGRPKGDKSQLTGGQRATALTAINRMAERFEESRVERIENDYSLSPEEKVERLNAIPEERQRFKEELYREYGITPANTKVQDPAAPAQTEQGKTDRQPPAAPAQPAIQEGATATNKQTGERIIFRNGQWQPL
jgi:hypothetical protein